MGSFNETCALSGFNIAPGTPVKVVFLTQNPYVKSDEREAHRGCYIYDQWFARTPPISGVYNDYGHCAFEEDIISRVIEEMFRIDLVERPFGWNPCHAFSVKKSDDIHRFLQVAWQGRLLVKESFGGKLEETEHFDLSTISWKSVQYSLHKQNLLISHNTFDEGYVAQPVHEGVVSVTINGYNDPIKKLMLAEKVLAEQYDCKIVFQEFEHNGKTHKNDPCLLVATKGAFENHNLILDSANKNAIKVLNQHPKQFRDYASRPLPALSVMIREDVWNAYLEIVTKDVLSLGQLKQQLSEELADKTRDSTIYHRIQQRFTSIPFRALLGEHVIHCHKMTCSEEEKQKVYSAAIELDRIEQIRSYLHLSWHIPCLGGQEGEWELRVDLQEKLLQIAQKQLLTEREEQESEE